MMLGNRLATSGESRRALAMGEAVRLITNLLRCVLWLVKQGVYITGFQGRRGNCGDQVIVTVAASPWLYRLFSDECTWQQRRQEGCLTIYTWFAIRFGIRIEWEEVCAYPNH